MLTPEDRTDIGQLSSYTMEQLSRRILLRLGANQHFAPHLQVQKILAADPTIIKEEYDKLRERIANDQSNPD
jgi:hypothetical protein